MRRQVFAVLVAAAAVAVCSLPWTGAVAEPRMYDPSTKIRLTCPAAGPSAATTAPEGEKGRVTFFASGERVCLCVGKTTCGPNAADGGVCLDPGTAIDLRMPGAVPLSCWSQNGFGVAEVISW